MTGTTSTETTSGLASRAAVPLAGPRDPATDLERAPMVHCARP
jgi:hypothetical protein